MIDFLVLWQTLPSKIDPVAFQICGFQVRYYGLMYILAFLTTHILVNHRVKNEKGFSIYNCYTQEIIVVLTTGILLGGRIGYILFYNFSYYLQNPLDIILPVTISNGLIVFTGFQGMSYHGGLLGAIAAVLIFAKLHKLNFYQISDLFIPAIPLGYTLGRLGNFMNGELYGRPTTSLLGMYFPNSDINNLLRHPSQLYEALFEGLLMFAVLWVIRKKKFAKGFLFEFYLIGYGIIRFIIEYVRQPDSHIGFVWFDLSMGQLLCIPMILVGFILTLHHHIKSKIND